MPLETREFDLEAEADRLLDEMVEAAEKQAEYPRGSDGAKEYAEQGQRYERLREGVLWARETWDTDTITLGSLTNGNRRLIQKLGQENAELNASDRYVAIGTVAAPYLEHDPQGITPNDVLETTYALGDVDPRYVDWAESQISDLSRIEADEGKSYQALVREKRNQTS